MRLLGQSHDRPKVLGCFIRGRPKVLKFLIRGGERRMNPAFEKERWLKSLFEGGKVLEFLIRGGRCLNSLFEGAQILYSRGKGSADPSASNNKSRHTLLGMYEIHCEGSSGTCPKNVILNAFLLQARE